MENGIENMREYKKCNKKRLGHLTSSGAVEGA